MDEAVEAMRRVRRLCDLAVKEDDEGGPDALESLREAQRDNLPSRYRVTVKFCSGSFTALMCNKSNRHISFGVFAKQ